MNIKQLAKTAHKKHFGERLSIYYDRSLYAAGYGREQSKVFYSQRQRDYNNKRGPSHLPTVEEVSSRTDNWKSALQLPSEVAIPDLSDLPPFRREDRRPVKPIRKTTDKKETRYRRGDQAERIVRWRQQLGDFRPYDDLPEVRKDV